MSEDTIKVEGSAVLLSKFDRRESNGVPQDVDRVFGSVWSLNFYHSP